MLSILMLVAAQGVSVQAAPAASPAQALPERDAEFLKKNYPPESLKAGEQGKVGFRVMIGKDGAMGSCEVTQSSGFKRLDSETCELLVRYANINPERDSDGRPIQSTREGFINWTLPGRAARAAVRKASQSASADPDKMICRRTVTTGSLVSATKQCMTKREWSRAAYQAQDNIDQMGLGRGHVEDESMNPGGPGGPGGPGSL